jgi:hypothetical protein
MRSVYNSVITSTKNIVQITPSSCYKEGCNKPPAWQGYVMFWLSRPWQSYGEARGFALACDLHRDAGTIADVLTDDVWSLLSDTLLRFGADPPERTDVEVEFRPIAAGTR